MRKSLKKVLTIALSAVMLVSTVSYTPVKTSAASVGVTNQTAEFSSSILLADNASHATEYTALNAVIGADQATFGGVGLTNYSRLSGVSATVQTEGNTTNAQGIIDGAKDAGVQPNAIIPTYFTVNLGAVKSISVMALKWQSAAASTYTIDFSEDGETWTTVAYILNYPKGLVGDRIDEITLASSTNTQYVRVTVTSLVSGYGANLREISIFGDGTSNGGTPVSTKVPYTYANKAAMPDYNLALKKTNLYQSGRFEGALANLVDGNTDGGHWASQEMNAVHPSGWFVIDLGQEYELSQIEAVFVQWKNNDGTTPVDGLKVMVTNELNVVTDAVNVQTVTQDTSSWTTVYDSKNSTDPIWDNNYASVIELDKSAYAGKFRYIKVQSDYISQGRAWGIQAYECAVIKADEAAKVISTSRELAPIGYQLSTDLTGIAKEAPAFRIVSKCPSTVLKKNVKSFGTLFVPTSLVKESEVNEFLTCEFDEGLEPNQRPTVIPATENGVIEDWDITDAINTYYVATVKKSTAPSDMAAYCQKEYYIRTYCVIEGDEGDEYVYSKEIETISIYEIAQNLYEGQRMNSLSMHNYLYNNIISIVNPEAATVDFNWGNSIYTGK